MNPMPRNTGVIIEVRPTDFIAGAETGIALSPLENGGQYDLFLPDEETQFKSSFDTFGCVSFSALNCLETAFNHLITGKKISATNLQWLKDNGYIDFTGKINFSDRFIAKLSNTGKAGNSLGAVGDAIRNFGIVPEKQWAWPTEIVDGMTNDEKWNIYYKAVPTNVQAIGLEFKKRFDVSYQWIVVGTSNPDTIKAYLPYGTIQVAAAICSPWSSTEAMPPIKGCGCGTQHATIIYGYNDGVFYKDFDHYKSFKKTLAWDYCLPYAVQYYVKEKVIAPTPSKPMPPTTNIAYGAPDSPQVRQLQSCLQYLGYMKTGIFGPFGPQTRTAFAAFQVAHNIPDSPQGTNYGPKSRAAMQKDLGL